MEKRPPIDEVIADQELRIKRFRRRELLTNLALAVALTTVIQVEDNHSPVGGGIKLGKNLWDKLESPRNLIKEQYKQFYDMVTDSSSQVEFTVRSGIVLVENTPVYEYPDLKAPILYTNQKEIVKNPLSYTRPATAEARDQGNITETQEWLIYISDEHKTDVCVLSDPKYPNLPLPYTEPVAFLPKLFLHTVLYDNGKDRKGRILHKPVWIAEDKNGYKKVEVAQATKVPKTN